LGVMMQLVKSVAAILLCASALGGAARAAEQEADQWVPLSRFIGEWTGTASGEVGDGTVTRKYTFIMNGRFIHETNTSRYPPQEKNKSGEIHEHWGIFSYDKVRKLLVLRQFHIEGFVNTYRQARATEGHAPLVFESEAFENFSNSWKARESYKFPSDDEFIETFELAPPSKPFQVYSRNHFKRVSK
jgi:hypothetical protein